MPPRQQASNPRRSVFQWFLSIFSIFILLSLMLLVPLLLYCRNVFSKLELQKASEQLTSGVNLLDTTVSGIANASTSIYNDNRFISLHYTGNQYLEASAVTRNQMRDYLASLTLSNPLITDCALQISSRDAVTRNATLFDPHFDYYPFFFQVDDLGYEEWLAILTEKKTGYIPVHHITTPDREYDGLIYSIQWSTGKYFYACIDMADIFAAMVAEDNLEDCRITIADDANTCYFTNLEADATTAYRTISKKAASGGLTVTVHIPESLLSRRMQPLYRFAEIYLVVAILVLGGFALLGVRITSNPILQIINTLERKSEKGKQHKLLPTPEVSSRLGYGFRYINSQIQSYEDQLQQYESVISTQKKVLQARFMEKALHGMLVTENDYNTFSSHFPQFPREYQLLMLGFTEKPEAGGNVYSNVLAMIQCYLQQVAPNAYIQQLSENTLLMVLEAGQASQQIDTINSLLDNINRYEPCYHAWGIVSKAYQDLQSIFFAYLQITDLLSKISTDSLLHICSPTEYSPAKNSGFQVSDTIIIYNAITNGNEQLALHYVQSYTQQLKNRSVYEMFYAILLSIRQEYADLLMDVKIPLYRAQADMYPALCKCVSSFCQIIQAAKQTHSDSFATQIRKYVDLHYQEESLCSASMEEHFQCSFVKIRKSFSAEFGITVTAYIEQKRMALANELLLNSTDSVMDICPKCGYSNYNTFLKAYRRTYGVAPSAAKTSK